jgi:UDP-N-acetylmuramyl-tripeptide synthetase
MTTPDPEDLYRMLAVMVEDGVEYVVMEVTSHALALGKLEPIHFAAAVFTNLTPEHLDFHGTMDAYADAKASLFSKSECSVINADSPHAARMLAMAGGDVVTCSAEGRCTTYQALEVEQDDRMSVRYTLSSANRRIHLRCPIPGRFTVMNSMQAAIVALELGIRAATVKEALASVAGVKGRMERVKLGPDADITVLIDYAHTPDALENLLRTAAQMRTANSRILLVFGCGGDRDRTKRAPMGRIAATLADEVILTSDNSRGENPQDIVAEILSGVPQREHCRVILDRERAIRDAVLHAREGDLLLLAGKGHETYEIGKDGRRPFCEEQIVKDAFLLRRNRKKQPDGGATEEDKT